MKSYSFNLDKRQVRQMFSPVRNKVDVINLLMNTIKIMILDDKLKDDQIHGNVFLVVSKMSRLFYIIENKYFSINFPFSVFKSDDGLIFSSKNIPSIDSKIISEVLGFIPTMDNFSSNCIYEFSDKIADIAECNVDFWPLLLELFIFEDGYIRYEYDRKNENGLFHPLHHYDVFYTSNSSFKIGLKSSINDDVLVDLLKVESECHFIEVP